MESPQLEEWMPPSKHPKPKHPKPKDPKPKHAAPTREAKVEDPGKGKGKGKPALGRSSATGNVLTPRVATGRPSPCLAGTRLIVVASALIALVFAAARMSAVWHLTVPATLAAMAVIVVINLVPLAPLLDCSGNKLSEAHPALIILIDIISGALAICSVFSFAKVWDDAAEYEATWPPPFATDFNVVVGFYAVIYLMLIVLLLYDGVLALARLRLAIREQQQEGVEAEKPHGAWARLCHWYVGLWILGGGEAALDRRLRWIRRGQMAGGGGGGA